ncbi:hypothetical protein I553_3391 [Mycobacterium xenopi 4042]|uniref:Uncharacterized protein n=1 Tax=Mycobacterium xenopi 4042 TaxID=1299334 RepID=X8BEK4_MYCXE|nr:hypothetical protein I553_3391 [Mycobacterium xenopi 4042]
MLTQAQHVRWRRYRRRGTGSDRAGYRRCGRRRRGRWRRRFGTPPPAAPTAPPQPAAETRALGPRLHGRYLFSHRRWRWRRWNCRRRPSRHRRPRRWPERLRRCRARHRSRRRKTLCSTAQKLRRRRRRRSRGPSSPARYAAAARQAAAPRPLRRGRPRPTSRSSAADYSVATAQPFSAHRRHHPDQNQHQTLASTKLSMPAVLHSSPPHREDGAAPFRSAANVRPAVWTRYYRARAVRSFASSLAGHYSVPVPRQQAGACQHFPRSRAAPRGGSPIIDSLVYRFCLHRAAGPFVPDPPRRAFRGRIPWAVTPCKRVASSRAALALLGIEPLVQRFDVSFGFVDRSLDFVAQLLDSLLPDFRPEGGGLQCGDFGFLGGDGGLCGRDLYRDHDFCRRERASCRFNLGPPLPYQRASSDAMAPTLNAAFIGASRPLRATEW